MRKRLLCFLFGHDWRFYLTLEEKGYPQLDLYPYAVCLRCGLTRDHS